MSDLSFFIESGYNLAVAAEAVCEHYEEKKAAINDQLGSAAWIYVTYLDLLSMSLKSSLEVWDKDKAINLGEDLAKASRIAPIVIGDSPAAKLFCQAAKRFQDSVKHIKGGHHRDSRRQNANAHGHHQHA